MEGRKMRTRLIYLVGVVTAAFSIVGILLATLSASTDPLATSSTVTSTDDFDSTSLDDRWSWIRGDVTHWSLTAHPGFMRITTQKGAFFATQDTKNLLLQPAPAGDFEIRTRLIFTPTENIHQAGLLAYQDDANLVVLSRAYCDLPYPGCKGNSIYFDQQEQGQLIGSNFAMTTTVLGEAYLRLVRHGAVYTGYVSENGTDWITVGTHTVISGMVPSKVGLLAQNGDFSATEIPADFDFFQVDDNSNRLFLPLIIK
jgi:beta-xylosidase